MDKRIIIQLIVARLSKDLGAIAASAKAAHSEATHEQNKPEGKYDTRALEASYLARSQSRQVAELENAKQEYEALPPHDWLSDAPIDVGALLTLEHGDGKTCYFLGPKAGGVEIVFEKTPVTVITPHSPIGRQLMGKKPGEAIDFRGESWRIVQVQ